MLKQNAAFPFRFICYSLAPATLSIKQAYLSTVTKIFDIIIQKYIQMHTHITRHIDNCTETQMCNGYQYFLLVTVDTFQMSTTVAVSRKPPDPHMLMPGCVRFGRICVQQ